MIHGGAGTGKTMLAVELVRRLSAQGRRVLLTCYNRELGLWLERNARDIGASHVTAGHLHRLLRSRILASPFRDELPADGTVDETWLTISPGHRRGG
ncbi:MAG: DUF2075 domain-containing protein [Chloroflexi bacterium]|nr:DUF2075 domain-containing protein [Chloroflexota bacterium]